MLNQEANATYSNSTNRLPLNRRAEIVGLLCEGNGLRATSRLADVSINTVTKLLVDVGEACEQYQDRTLRNLECRRVQWALFRQIQTDPPPPLVVGTASAYHRGTCPSHARRTSCAGS